MIPAGAGLEKNSKSAMENNFENSLVVNVQNFVKKAFQENPHYSFGDWSIMYEHSVMVKDISLQIAESVDCDKILLSIEALLHDIGKTYKASGKVLHQQHAELGYEVTKDFLPSLDLTKEQKKKLIQFLQGDVSSIEGQIIKDADCIAFFSDIVLQKAFKNWAEKEGLLNELQRKADKINTLHFEVSRKLATPYHSVLKEKWELK